MRVPVRLPIQCVQAPQGLRRAVAPSARQRQGLALYGGDVRTRNPLSLVFHGNLGQEDMSQPVLYDTGGVVMGPSGPVPQTYVIYATAEPAPAISVTYPDILLETGESGAYSPPYQPPPVAYADILPSIYSTDRSVATPPFLPPNDTSSSWWQDLSRFLQASVGPTAVIAQAIRGPGAPGAGVTSYIIPATATSPAQRVYYNPATGQVTTTPAYTAASALPGFLQAAPGAAWYSNPLLLLGGGLVAVLFVVMAARR